MTKEEIEKEWQKELKKFVDYHSDKMKNMTEEELVVVLLIDHLLQDGNTFINAKTLALNMNYDEKKLDKILTVLLEKHYIDYQVKEKNLAITLEPLVKILYKKFQESIFTEEDILHNEEVEKFREEVFSSLTKIFGRSLTPNEMNIANDWIASETDYKIIEEALKTAAARKFTNINLIDREIVRRIRESESRI